MSLVSPVTRKKSFDISAQRLEFYDLELPWQLSYSLNDILSA
jgi:hypothetical protein